MEIKTDKILWLSRGIKWDYTFLLKPIAISHDGWFNFSRRDIFPKIEAVLDSYKMAFGVLRTSTKNLEYPFIAFTWLSKEFTDWTNRPIRHDVILFGESGETINDMIQNLPENWPELVMKQLLKIYDSDDIYKLTEEKIIIYDQDKSYTLEDHIQNRALKLSSVFIEKQTLNQPLLNEWINLGNFSIVDTKNSKSIDITKIQEFDSNKTIQSFTNTLAIKENNLFVLKILLFIIILIILLIFYLLKYQQLFGP